ncbi:MAG: hypothetical protein AAFO81_04050 [Pseudomonadota bacterium]
MKAILTMIAGFAIGFVLVVVALLYNPTFDGDNTNRLSGAEIRVPIIGDDVVSVAAGQSGYPWLTNFPADAQSPAIAGMRSAYTATLASTDGNTSVAYVLRLSALTQAGKPLFGEVIDESTWYVVMPRRGTFIVSSQDDLWSFIRPMAMPMLRGDTWRGDLQYVTTLGPSNGFADVVGISGTFANQSGRAALQTSIQEASVARGITRGKSTLFVDIRETPSPDDDALAASP